MRISLLVPNSAIMLDIGWKLLAGILLLTLASSQAAESNQEADDILTDNVSLTRSNLRELLESLRYEMQNGNESLGIPVLDPYEADELIINLDQDCLTVNTILENVLMEGLSDYTVDTASFSLLRMRITVDLTWPSVSIFTKYAVKGNTGVVPVYGSGNVVANAKKVTFSSVSNLAVNTDLSVYIRTFTSELAMEALDFTITGIYDSEETSQFASSYASNNAPQLLAKYQSTLNNKLNEIVVERLNVILSTMTLSDLISLIS